MASGALGPLCHETAIQRAPQLPGWQPPRHQPATWRDATARPRGRAQCPWGKDRHGTCQHRMPERDGSRPGRSGPGLNSPHLNSEHLSSRSLNSPGQDAEHHLPRRRRRLHGVQAAHVPLPRRTAQVVPRARRVDDRCRPSARRGCHCRDHGLTAARSPARCGTPRGDGPAREIGIIMPSGSRGRAVKQEGIRLRAARLSRLRHLGDRELKLSVGRRAEPGPGDPAAAVEDARGRAWPPALPSRTGRR